ncbi:uncharacterized protein LOC114741165 [Neltuma alba]|uniref:uncharacterized protein LOC114741165 n=1 Tax=Neltuma alba TaxID=207710 RepID=UPI0010A4CCA6|nr:uncharacterized protein LOC114741165 [Prosopis alba]
MELDWNDVEIKVIGLTPDIPVVKCGVYVCKQQTNMENIQFKSPMLFMNASTTPLKRRAIASPNEPPKKVLRKLKTTDKGKINNIKKGSRRNKRHQLFHSRCKRWMVFPMAKHVWRFLSY